MSELPHPAPDLQEQLELARSIDDVVEACSEFVMRFTPAQLQSLVSACRPPDHLDGETISAYAVELVRADLKERGSQSQVLRMFARFFGDAAACIARIGMARGRQDGWAYMAWRR